MQLSGRQRGEPPSLAQRVHTISAIARTVAVSVVARSTIDWHRSRERVQLRLAHLPDLHANPRAHTAGGLIRLCFAPRSRITRRSRSAAKMRHAVSCGIAARSRALFETTPM
jgi:hypothetical protein